MRLLVRPLILVWISGMLFGVGVGRLLDAVVRQMQQPERITVTENGTTFHRVTPSAPIPPEPLGSRCNIVVGSHAKLADPMGSYQVVIVPDDEEQRDEAVDAVMVAMQSVIVKNDPKCLAAYEEALRQLKALAPVEWSPGELRRKL